VKCLKFRINYILKPIPSGRGSSLEDFDTSADELEEIERVKPLWIERFESINSLKSFVPSFKKVKTQTQFNTWLGRVYDFCDDNRIWVEF